MAKLNPYLMFNDDKCKEAMTFYQQCFGGELFFQTIGESPMAGEMPPENHNKIIHASLKNGELELLASDMMRDKAIIGDNVTITINCTNEEEINTYFKKLSEGGEVFMPLEKTFWDAIFGMVTDKYGVEWKLNFPIEK
jgi:PhnB protein